MYVSCVEWNVVVKPTTNSVDHFQEHVLPFIVVEKLDKPQKIVWKLNKTLENQLALKTENKSGTQLDKLLKK